MSANNYLLVARESGAYSVYEKNADTHDTLFVICKELALEQAIEVASRYCCENEVEYGMRFSFKEEESEATP